MSVNQSGRNSDLPKAPPGQRAEIMTLLFTDMVGSTRLKEELGSEEAVNLIQKHHALIRTLLAEFPDAFEVDTAGDSFFLAFRRASEAVRFALQMQARLQVWNRRNRRPLLDRVGIHVGEVIVETDHQTGGLHDVHGLEVDKCARVMSLADGNHILLTRFAFDNARGMLKGQRVEGVGAIRWATHGLYELKGVAEPVEICEVAEVGLTSLLAPRDSEKAHRLDAGSESEVVATQEGPLTAWLRAFTVGQRLNRRLAIWGAILTAAVGAFALVLPFARPLANASYDLAYVFRPTEVPAEAVIVRMDRDSHDQLKQPWMQAWDRKVHAQLIDKLREFNAQAVVFDVLFDRPADDPSQDAALIAAAKRFGKVAVAGVVNFDLRNGAVVGRRIEGPFLELRDVVQWGLVSNAGSDLTVRQPMLGHAEKKTLEAVVAQFVSAPRRVLPTGAHWLNYYGPPGTIESFSYSEVLAGHISPQRFANKIVFVGAVYDVGFTGGRGTDDFNTPYSLWTGLRAPGVEVTATASLNLIRADWLRRLSPWAELGLVVAFGLLSGYGWCVLRPLTGVIVSALTVLVLALVATTLVWHTRVWFPWLVVCATQVPFAFAWSVLALASGANERRSGRRRQSKSSGSTGEASAIPPAVPVPLRPSVMSPSTDLLVPNYKLLRQIGRGAYGEVWLAQDSIGLYRALKIVYRRTFSDPTPYEREFEGMRRFTPLSLQHPGLVQVLHVGREEERGYFYYVMELADDEVQGQQIDPDRYASRTLESDLQRRGSLSAHEVRQLGLDLAQGLRFLHQHRLVHRDLKPANTVYVRGAPKLGDVGLVTVMADAHRAVSFLGTKGYMAPEGPGHAAADVYSLGKVLYVAAMGQSPGDFPELPGNLDERPDRAALLELNHVLLRACDPQADQRYSSAEELLAALRDLESAQAPNL